MDRKNSAAESDTQPERSGEQKAAKLDMLALARYMSEHPAAALASEEKVIKALKPGPRAERRLFNERSQCYREAAAEKKTHPGP